LSKSFLLILIASALLSTAASPSPQPTQANSGRVPNFGNNQTDNNQTRSERPTAPANFVVRPNSDHGETKTENKPAPPIAPTIIVHVDSHDRTIAAASIVLAVAAIVQLFLLRATLRANELNADATAKQARTLESTLKETRKAADAATKSAEVAERALQTTNRPLLDVEKWTLSMKDTWIPYLEFSLKNFGNSPAWITGFKLRFTTIPSMTNYPEPNCEGMLNLLFRDLSGRLIPAGESVPLTAPHENFSFSETDYKQLRKAFSYLLAFGLVKYDDIRGDGHETAFSAQYRFITLAGLDMGDESVGVWDINVGPPTYHYHDRKKPNQNTGLSKTE
jgi:hypothetical protein